MTLKDDVEAARREPFGDFGDIEECQKACQSDGDQVKIVSLHGAVAPGKLAIEEPNPCWYGEDNGWESIGKRADDEAPSLPAEPRKPAHDCGADAERSKDEEGDPFVAHVEAVGWVEVEEGGE